jgi:hypothetical protein
MLLPCLILFLVGCQTLPPEKARLTAPAQRFVMKNYSVSAPTGDAWLAQKQGENSILFYKGTDAASGHTVVAGVEPFVPPSHPKSRDEFQRLLQETLAKEQGSSERFRNTDLEFSPDNRFGEYSIRVHFVSKDFSPYRLPSGADYLVLNTYAHYIKLPKTNEYLHVWYSERSRPEHGDPALAEKAGGFFESFQLLSAGTKP